MGTSPTAKKISYKHEHSYQFQSRWVGSKKKLNLRSIRIKQISFIWKEKKNGYDWIMNTPAPPPPMWHSAARSEAQYVSRLEGVRCEFITLVVVGTEENGIRAHLSVTIPCFLGARWLRVPTGLEGEQYKTLADAASCTPFIVLYHICTCVCIA